MNNSENPGMSSEPQTDGKAIGSLVCGIASVTIFSIIAGIPAIILGHISRSDIRKSEGRLKGEGLALAGLIMGYISLAIIPLILIIATIAIPGLIRGQQAAHEAAAVSTLWRINTAEETYKRIHGNSRTCHERPGPLRVLHHHGWRGSILHRTGPCPCGRCGKARTLAP